MKYAADIRTFIVSNFLYGDDAQLKDHSSFLNGGILDSTGILELVTFLETTYNIQIETDELLPSNLDSILNVSRFLEQKLSMRNAGSLSTTDAIQPESASQPCVYAPQPDESET